MADYLDDFFSVDVSSQGSRIAKGKGLNFDATKISATYNPNSDKVDITLANGALVTQYIVPTGSGGTSGLSVGRFDIDNTNPYGPIPGTLSFGNDDGSDYSLQIDGSTSTITSKYALKINARTVEASHGRVLTHSDSPVTAVDGDVLFLNTSGGAILVTLPVALVARVEVYVHGGSAATLSCSGTVNGSATLDVPSGAAGLFRGDGTNVWGITA